MGLTGTLTNQTVQKVNRKFQVLLQLYLLSFSFLLFPENLRRVMDSRDNKNEIASL